ncbi:MAG: phosphoribosylglycinamide formyltransferase [Clostridia bacterium]|jgi:phosphoribosylglycinamide formyltransferase-1
MSITRVGVLVSGGGTNLQALIDAIETEAIPAQIVVVISNKKKAYALERAREKGIPTIYINPKEFATRDEYDRQIKSIMDEKHVDLIVLAGYLSILGKEFVQSYQNRIINVHPSLIPSFCGPGYYGDRVHQAVLDYGVKVSGATVHFVDEGTDTGPIILQECVPVLQDDDVRSLANRVLEVEHRILPEAVRLFAEGRLLVVSRRVMIKD